MPKLKTVGKVAGKTLGAAGAVGSGISALKVASGAIGGDSSDIQLSDLKNSIYGFGAARGLLKNARLNQLANSLKTEGKATEKLISGEHTFELPKEHGLELPKFKKPLLGKINKEKTEAINKELADKFRENYKKVTGNDLPDTFKFEGASIQLPEKNLIKTQEESGMSPFQYERAQKRLQNKISYFHPSYLSTKYKNGGVIKAQYGVSLGQNKLKQTTYPLDFSSKTASGAMLPGNKFAALNTKINSKPLIQTPITPKTSSTGDIVTGSDQQKDRFFS